MYLKLIKQITIDRKWERENLENYEKNDEIEIDLLHLAKVLMKKWWLILLVTIITGVASLVGTLFFVTPLYTSDVKFYVNNSDISVGNITASITSGDISAAQSLVDTYIVILKSRSTINDVIQRGGLDYSYGQLASMVEASSVNGTEIFEVTVTNKDPEMAKKIANDIAEILPLQIADIVSGSSVSVVDYAISAQSQSSPNISQNALIGALLGMVLIMAILVIKDLMNPEIKTEDELSNLFGIPILASIPNAEDSMKV